MKVKFVYVQAPHSVSVVHPLRVIVHTHVVGIVLCVQEIVLVDDFPIDAENI